MIEYEELASNVEHNNFSDMVAANIAEEQRALAGLDLDHENLLYVAAQAITYLKISETSMNHLIANNANKAIAIIHNAALLPEQKEVITSKIIAQFRTDIPKILATQNKKVASKGGKQKALNDKDGKQAAKKEIKKEWDQWQLNPSRYKNISKFANDMQEKHKEILESTKVICDWCRKWKKKNYNPTK